MNARYVVVSKSGEGIPAQKYIQRKGISPEMQILVKREALGEVSQQKKGGSRYLAYAKKYGFSWEKHADIGFMSMDYKANLMHRLVKEYARQVVHKIGLPIYEVSGSHMFDMSHPVVDAYAKLYGERLFQPHIRKKQLVMNYDCSYPQFNLAEKYQLSYRHFPFAHFSIGDCFRLEQSGECMLFYRGRQFVMPDLHPYMRDIEEAWDWVPRIEEQIVHVFNEAQREYVISLALSSEKYFEEYLPDIKAIAQRNRRDILVEIPLDDQAKYWIINIDYKIIDASLQPREIACIQIDIANAKRLGISYVDEEGKNQYPIIIHSAVSGGIERYLYMIFDQFEHYVPLWLRPIQLRMIPVHDVYIEYAKELEHSLAQLRIRIDIDDRNFSLGKKVKLAKEAMVPYICVIGEKEKNDKSSVYEVAAKIAREVSGMPYIPREWPSCVSQQI